MPTAAGPNSNEQGLVFAIDLGDIKNSYVGEPTVNLASGIQNWDSWGGATTIREDAPEKGPGWKKITITDINGTNHRLAKYPYLTQTANTTRTYSVEYDTNGLTGYSLKIDGNGGFGIFPISGRGRFSQSISTTSNWVEAIFLIRYGTYNNISDVLYFKEYQVEEKTHATIFTNGTRLATESLLDLTGNTTPDVSNMSFDANSQLVFDGTDDGINVGNATILSLSNGIGTVEAVVKFPSSWTAGSQYPNLISKGATAGWDTDGWALFGFRDWGGPKSWGFGMRNGATNRVTSRNNCPADVYLHIVATIDGSTIKLYENGVLYTTNTQTINPAANNTNVYIGRDASSQRFPGEIPVAKIYNRTLSAEEVANNYNVLKKRFNI